MAEKKRVSHLNTLTPVGLNPTERGLPSGGKEILQKVEESADKNNPHISASEVSQVNHMRTYPGKSHPHFIEDNDTCLCGRKLSDNYYKDVEDNCYVHMSKGY